MPLQGEPFHSDESLDQARDKSERVGTSRVNPQPGTAQIHSLEIRISFVSLKNPLTLSSISFN